MMVKVCGITNTADAFAAIGCGAGALGFNFWPKSPRYITPNEATGLLDRLPSGVLKIGLFVNEAPARILEVAARLSLDAVQIHGNRPLPESVPVWKAFSVTPDFERSQLDQYEAEAFVL
ncbi:MAG: phosphoribosylanthranilate isomerase, partial [bacterium]|nr:phosphoribosylanthranilate isomerase [bacterium]